MTSRRDFLSKIAVTSGVMVASPVIMRPALAAKDPVYTSWGVAIRSTDPVAYFTENRPVKGKKEFSYIYDGAEFRFSSAEEFSKISSEP